MSELITTRIHAILDSRKAQLTHNLLALYGGQAYVHARLWRAPNESDRSWVGNAVAGIPGRQDRAYVINDAGRVVKKINDYLFSQDTTRDGVDDAWAADVTATGLSVRQFWGDVSEHLTAGQWVWLQVERGAPSIDPSTARPAVRSLADKERNGDRVYWAVWSPLEVVDWRFDAQGRLEWLLTEEGVYENSDPFKEPSTVRIRTLWQRGTPCTYKRYFLRDDGKVERQDDGAISMNEVPFVLLGQPIDKPWWFDDVELIQAAVMNLESLDFENLQQTVYPQLVLPTSMIESATAKLMAQYGTRDGAQVQTMIREIVRGLEYPFVEDSADSGLTRYLMPPTSDMKILTEKTEKLRSQIFDFAGLAMFARESRQVASAESKQWDHLDVEATLGNRALMLQECEKRMVAYSKQLDPAFREYAPIWPHEFSVPNTSVNVANLVQLGNFIDLPQSVENRMRVVAVELLHQIHPIPAADKQQMLNEIAAMQPPSAEMAVSDIGKVPLAIQQLALARERAVNGGDVVLAAKLGAKIDELTASI
jgi:hypothetical protein